MIQDAHEHLMLSVDHLFVYVSAHPFSAAPATDGADPAMSQPVGRTRHTRTIRLMFSVTRLTAPPTDGDRGEGRRLCVTRLTAPPTDGDRGEGREAVCDPSHGAAH